ncbi:GNAT family N-acetyltransferase [Vibrio methylphosphonaticus]|uniref:GNAT family N-acetyltransferase n=1 Tax=Vibrio methylphosphonaticus TaxID=2946866 RepID=UPI00202AA588|nr:GNAT family protein [Vibrio methylphosphonaticus]MCL9774664.1 GNAT family N-acetyltransferase [Vibrio methylphosphonaticus]
MNTNYAIYTPRLALRLLTLADATEFANVVRHSPSLHQWIDWCHTEFSDNEALEFIGATRLNWVKANAFGFGLFERETDRFVGMVALNEFYHTFNMGSLGYWIADSAHAKGYAKEGLEALIEFSFSSLLLTRLEIVCDPNNEPSQALAISVGATYECLADNRFIFNGQPKQGKVYAIIPPKK